MKVLVNANGKALVTADGKLATDACPGTCCGGDCPDVSACNYNGLGDQEDFSHCIYVSLSCDAISSSASKCGFSTLHTFGCCPLSPLHDECYGTTVTFPGCATGGCSAEMFDCGTCSGDSDPDKIYFNRTVTTTGAEEFGGCDQNCDTCGTQVVTSHYGPDCFLPIFEFDPEDGEGVQCCNADPIVFSHPVTATIVLSDEITDESLIAQAENLLEEYDDDFNDGCDASRTLSEDGTSYSFQRFRPKFTITQAFSQTIYVSYYEFFTPDVGSPSLVFQEVTIAPGETEVIGPEILEPGSNGTITVESLECSLESNA